MPANNHEVNIGIQLPTMDGHGLGHRDLRTFAREAEDLDIASVWIGDHFSFRVPVIEAFISATLVAAVTERLHIGFGVLVAALRHPAWVGKQLSSLQVVSGDRLLVGIGVGGEFEGEWNAVGVPRAERGRRTDELLTHLGAMLSGQAVDLGSPWDAHVPPLTPFGSVPPLWIGGRSDAALRRATRFGCGWMGVWLDEARLRSRIDRLRDLAQAAGTDVPPVGIQVLLDIDVDAHFAHERMRSYMEKIYGIPYEKLAPFTLAGDLERVVEISSSLIAQGLDTLVFMPAAENPLCGLHQVRQIMDALSNEGIACRSEDETTDRATVMADDSYELTEG